ncbi:MAG TPA: hypothetical protein VFX70_16785 [Mycobacteriales bacterium]|nr:hypothetical protein [Mycobacteriales bacterium]
MEPHISTPGFVTGPTMPTMPTGPHRPDTGPKRSWYRRAWVVAVAAGILGVLLGAAMGMSGSATSPAAQHQIDTARSAANRADAQRDQARAAQRQAESERDQARGALNDAQAGLTTRKAALDKRKSDLDARERKITDAEKAAKANSFGGDGIYLVGTDIQAGTYKAQPSPSGNCYTEVDRNLDGGLDSIMTNNNTSGPVVLQVPSSAKAIKVSGCGDFQKVG